jgi:hypothetical protein
MVSIVLEIITDVKILLENAYSPILVTKFGIIIDIKLLFSNA